MQKKTTGATSGIGKIAAERLAAMGARIILIARSKSRGEVTIARLQALRVRSTTPILARFQK